MTDTIPESWRSSLAHELNTSLAVIAGYAELLESRSDERTRREAATQIKAAAERLRSAIERFLAEAGAA